MEKAKSVEAYIEKHSDWSELLTGLRAVLLDTELSEKIKWGAPVYTLDNKNIVGFSAFKNHAGLWFFQGVFLDDPDNLLVNAQKGKTKALRQLRYEKGDSLDTDIVRFFVRQAIDNQKSGIELKPDRNKPLIIPGELDQAFQRTPGLKSYFKALTKGRQREYAEYISGARQDATRQRRLDKIIPMIEKGIGLNDKYR